MLQPLALTDPTRAVQPVAAGRTPTPAFSLAGPRRDPIAEAESQVGEARVRQIDTQARELEGVFLRMVMRRIQGSLGKSSFGSSAQSDFMTGMAFDEMGNAMAGGRQQGLGLGRMIYEVLLRDEAAKSAP